MNEWISVRWYCGNYYGPARWYGDHYEPEDCDTVFVTQAEEDDWNTGTANAICPKCKSGLWQADDDPEALIVLSDPPEDTP